MTEPNERDREMVETFLGRFLSAISICVNSATRDNARRAALAMAAAAREEGRREERVLVRRLLHSARSLAMELQDPGTEALAAIWEAERFLEGKRHDQAE